MNFQAFMNSKKNSRRGNYMRKYCILFVVELTFKGAVWHSNFIDCEQLLEDWINDTICGRGAVYVMLYVKQRVLLHFPTWTLISQYVEANLKKPQVRVKRQLPNARHYKPRLV